MRDYQYDHVHLRSPDPDQTARFFETMFGAEVTRSVYPPGTLYDISYAWIRSQIH
jgi:lactoylglutathione lyase